MVYVRNAKFLIFADFKCELFEIFHDYVNWTFEKHFDPFNKILGFELALGKTPY